MSSDSLHLLDFLLCIYMNSMLVSSSSYELLCKSSCYAAICIWMNAYASESSRVMLTSSAILELFFRALLSRLPAIVSRSPTRSDFLRPCDGVFELACSSPADISAFLPLVLSSSVIRGYVDPTAVLDLWSRSGFGCHRYLLVLCSPLFGFVVSRSE